MWTIGEVAQKFNLSISALRYYDKEGLLSDVKRENGIRKFDDKDIETIFMIECLKKAGMQIKDIKQFLDWVKEGNTTLDKRLKMFENQKVKVEKQIQDMQKVLDLIKYKCWYYETAVKEGSDEKVKNMKEEDMPAEILKLYKNSHS